MSIWRGNRTSNIGRSIKGSVLGYGLLFLLHLLSAGTVWGATAVIQGDDATRVTGVSNNAVVMVDQKASLAQPADNVSVNLEWDPSPSEGVAGYYVYYGNASGKYLPPKDAGNATSFTFSALSGKMKWFFAVRAYDAEGNLSGYSNEVVKEPVVTGSGQPSSVSSTAMSLSNDTPGSVVMLNEDFGVTPPAESRAARVSSMAAGRIVAGTGAWPGNGGWIKSLTDDFFHQRWCRSGWPHYNEMRGESRVAHGDIDGDGKDELIIGMGPIDGDQTAPVGVFEVLDDDFSHLYWGQVNWPDYNLGNGETWPACGDLDGDGRDEILIGLGSGGMGNVEVFTVSGHQLVHKSWLNSSWSEYNQARGEVRPASGDFDGDGRDDIILGFGRVKDDPAMPGGAYEVLSGDGQHLAWGAVSWSDYNELNGETRPVIGDLDGDGINEIVIGLGAGANGSFEVQGINENGQLTNQAWLATPWWQDYNQLNGETRPALGNLDADPADEIVVALGKGGAGWLHLFDDRESGFSRFLSLQLWPEAYNQANGASWVTILEEDKP